MVEQFEIFIALIFVFLGIIGIFEARHIIRRRFFCKNENLGVNTFKIISCLVTIVALICIYYIIR